jgi:hypothetical protein
MMYIGGERTIAKRGIPFSQIHWAKEFHRENDNAMIEF